MFGIDAAELVMIIVLAIVLFGPEKIPQLSRKAARVVVYLRDIANNAQTQLRSELGPEYADLNINDLNPKAFVKKHLSSEIAAIEEAKAELSAARQEIKDSATEMRAAAADAQTALTEGQGAAGELTLVGARFDTEAT